MSDQMYSVVILAGGLATRLRPVTETIPKSLVMINDEPFINHQLRLLSQRGIRHVVLCLGYLGEMIQQHVGDGSNFGLQVEYSYDGDVLLGTGGAIKRALPLLGEAFFILYGDSYLNCNYSAVQTAFEKSRLQGLMTVFKNTDLWDKSNIEYLNGKIFAYSKTKRTENMRYIDYGVGILTRETFNYESGRDCFDLSSLYETLLKHSQLAAYEVDKRFYEVGSFAGIKELEYYLTQKKLIADVSSLSI